MTKSHEHDQTKLTGTAATGHRAGGAPGRTTRTAALDGPNGQMPSGIVQRKARDANGVEDNAGEAVARASSSSGAPLPAMLMRKFEASLGADLSSVRVHTGSESEDAARAVGAKAYTVGQDIHFGAGHFDPSSPTGQHLLAHEVAHTVQQAGGVARMQLKPAVSSPGDTHEVEADRAADAMVSGNAFAIAGVGTGVQREADALGGNVTVQGEFGDQSASFGTDKHGSFKEGGGERVLFTQEFGEECGPGIYAGFSITAKLVYSRSGEGNEKEEKAKMVFEGGGSVGAGAAHGKAKIGIEGQIVLGVTTLEVKLGSDHLFEGDPEFSIVATVNLRLVAAATEHLKGNITKQLSQLTIFQGRATRHGIEGHVCSKEEITKAVNDLYDNSAAVGVLGAPGMVYSAIKQKLADDAAQKEFDESVANTPDAQMTSEQDARFRQTCDGEAARETDIHEKYNSTIELARRAAEAAKAPFNTEQARDPAWWKGSAYTTFNQGTVHMMAANQAHEQYKIAEGTNAVQPLAEKAIAEYTAARHTFRDAQKQQFGDLHG